MSDKQTRRHFTPQEKAAIVKRHLLEGAAVSALCDEFEINPTLFYQWQRQLFEHAHVAFDNGRMWRSQLCGAELLVEDLMLRHGPCLVQGLFVTFRPSCAPHNLAYRWQGID
jgi:transposase